MAFTHIVTDEALQSKLQYKNPDYPLSYYRDELDQMKENTISWHWHRSFEVSYVEAGTVDCKVGNQSFQLHAGDGIFINSGELHMFHASAIEGPVILKNLLFAPEFLAPAGSMLYQKYVLPLLESNLTYFTLPQNIDERQQCLQRVQSACALAESEDPFAPLCLQGELNQLWQVLFPLFTLPKITKGHTSKISQARTHTMIEFIHQNFHQKLTLSNIADAANISKREALRSFSESIKTSPIRYLNEYRLSQAEDLLISTSVPVTSIALDTGFENSGYFCKVFKRKHGISPLTYRKQHK